MLSKEDLIYFGAILIWSSDTYLGDQNKAVEQAKCMYNKVFKNNNDD